MKNKTQSQIESILKEQFNGLNPFKLRKVMDKKLNKIFQTLQRGRR